jgi:hypothetical protein
MLRLAPTGELNFFDDLYQIGDYPGGAFTVIKVSLNTWSHIALVKNGSSVKLYLNGQVVVSKTTASVTLPSMYLCEVGRNRDGGIPDFSGYIDEVCITKGLARYTENFTPGQLPVAPSNTLTIISANYHYNTGGSWNATADVISRVVDASLYIASAGCYANGDQYPDPVVGRVKTLEVTYSYNGGANQAIEVSQGGSISIP